MSEDGRGGGRGADVPPLIPSKPPGLLPIPGRESHITGGGQQDNKQVQAAIAMAWMQQMMAARMREHAMVPHPPPFPGLPGLPTPPGLPNPLARLPTLPGLASTTSGLPPGVPPPGVLPGAADVLERTRQEMYRDYLNKLAQSSTLHVTTSSGDPRPATQLYLPSPSTSIASIASIADIKPSLPLRSSSPSTDIHDTSRPAQRSPPPLSNYLGVDRLPTNLGPPFFGLPGLTQPSDAAKPMSATTTTRSPTSTNGGPGRRAGGASGREKVFTCLVCNRSFGYKHVLQNHERTHTGEKPFECKECHKRFTRDHHLKTHMRLHTGEKPYSCSHCDRQFVQVANLRRHLRVHTGERPYKCDICPSNFSDSNQLKAHNLIHKGEKPFSCDKCGGKFRRRHHLMHHVCPMDDKAPRTNHGQFLELKEQLLLRYTGAGFPHTGISLPASIKPPSAEDTSDPSNPSLSPDSKETGSGGSPTPGEADSTGEKRRSRKQKPRRVIQWQQGEGPREGEMSPRQLHVSSTFSHDGPSPVMPEQTEPEDLTIFRNSQDQLGQLKHDMRARLSRDGDLSQAFQKERSISQYSMAAYAIKDDRSEEGRFGDAKIKEEDAEEGRRSEEGSTSVSDPHSAHSTPGDKFRSEADMEEEEEDVDKGVSPPLSSTPFLNPLFSHQTAIQLGLAGTAMPLATLASHQRAVFTADKEAEWEKNHVKKEISQQ